MHKILKRFESGGATMPDLDLLLEVANNIEGNTICALGDAAAWPVQSMIKRFREEFEKKVKPTLAIASGAPVIANGAPVIANGAPVIANGAPVIASAAKQSG
jgi:NADH-quinone oxidoreductase subunit F